MAKAAKKTPRKRKAASTTANHRHPVTIAPSILAADFSNLGSELGRCRRSKATWIHVDVMDGHFVPNITFGPPLVKSWKAAEPKLTFDTHLMIEDPMKLAPAFRDAGSDIITIHVETVDDPAKQLRTLKKLGVKAGISIKPATPVKAIRDCLKIADLVLVMTVEPGFGGQQLIPKTLNKVRELDLLRRDKGFDFYLQVDGGINESTTPLAVAAGADVLVAGSAVFNAKRSIAQNLKSIRQIIADASTGNGSNGALASRPKSAKK